MMSWTVVSAVAIIAFVETTVVSANCQMSNTRAALRTCCQAENHDLPAMTDLQSFRSVTVMMGRRNLTSVWLGLQRKVFNQWTWINNISEHRIRDATPRARCGILNTTSHSLHAGSCSEKHGHLCQVKDCTDCSSMGSLSLACRKLGRHCYLHICDNLRWDDARVTCLKAGRDLAVVADQTLMDNIGEGQHSCKTYWVGVRKESWQHVTTSTTLRTVSRWANGEPADREKCSVMTYNGAHYTWRTAECNERHHAVCHRRLAPTSVPDSNVTDAYSDQGTRPTTSSQPTDPPVMPLGLIIGLAVGVILVASVSLGAVWCYLRKRRRSRQAKGDVPESFSLLNKIKSESNSLRQILATIILRDYSHLQLWAFGDDVVHMALDDIYTDMAWGRQGRAISPSTQEDIQHYSLIFNADGNNLPPKRILVHGEAGAGKTTIVKKMLTDWSRHVLGKLSEKDDNHKKIANSIGQFKYVLPIFLRDVRDGETMETVLSRQLKLDNLEAQELSRELRNESHKSLLILEGYDEFRKNLSTDIENILNSTRLPKLNILTTCRAPHSSYFPREDKFDLKIEIIGFSKESVTRYIDRYFNKLSHLGKYHGKDGLLDSIDVSEDLRHMSRIPAVLLLMCILWREQGALSPNVTGFYRDFVKYMCARYGEKYLEPDQKLDRENIFKLFFNELLSIGRIAFDGLKGDVMKLRFLLSDIEAQIDDDKTMKLGFFKQEDEKLGTKYVAFHHRTIQEFFAAFYIVHCDDSKRLTLLTSFCSSRNRLQESQQILTFVAGLGGSSVRYHVEQALGGWDEEATVEKTNFLLTYLDENKDANTELPKYIIIYMSPFHKSSTYKRFFQMPTSNLKKLTVHVSDPVDLTYLQNLTAADLEELEIHHISQRAVFRSQAEDSKTLDLILPRFNLTKLSLVGFPSRAEPDVRDICTNLDELGSLCCLSFCLTHISDEFVSHIAEKIQKLTCLTDLQLNSGGCSYAKGMVALLRKLAQRKTLQTLDLSDNIVDAPFYENLTETLTTLTGLVELKLPDRSETDVHHSVEFVSTLKNLPLKVLASGKYTLPEEGLSRLCAIFSKLKYLERLVLTNCGCREKGLWKSMIQQLPQAQYIRELNLSENDIGDSCVIELVLVLPQTTKLQILHLTQCHIEQIGTVVSLLESLKHPLPVQRLYLSGNNLGDGLLKITELKHFGRLEYLSLTNNGLSQACSDKIHRVLKKTSPKLVLELHNSDPKASDGW